MHTKHEYNDGVSKSVCQCVWERQDFQRHAYVFYVLYLNILHIYTWILLNMHIVVYEYIWHIRGYAAITNTRAHKWIYRLDFGIHVFFQLIYHHFALYIYLHIRGRRWWWWWLRKNRWFCHVMNYFALKWRWHSSFQSQCKAVHVIFYHYHHHVRCSHLTRFEYEECTAWRCNIMLMVAPTTPSHVMLTSAERVANPHPHYE